MRPAFRRPDLGATGRRAFTLIAALTLTVSGPLPLLLLGTLAVQLRDDLGLAETQVGIASTMFFLGSSVLSVPAGALTDRVGWQWASHIGSVGSAASLLLVALLADGLWTFLPLFLIGSTCHAVAGPAGNVAIAAEMPTHRRALLFGMKQTANPIANLFAGISVPLIGLTAGWRWAFAVAAVFPLIAVVSTQLTYGSPATPASRRARVHAADAALPPRVSLRALPIVALATAGGLASFGVSALGAYLVLSSVDAGVDEGLAGLYISAAAVVGLLVRVLSGWWADRVGSSGLRPIAVMLAVGSISYLGLAIGDGAVVLPATVLAYGAGWGWPGLFQFAIAHHYGSATGRISGRVGTGLMFGGVVGPLVFSALQHRWGYGPAWISVAAAALLSAAAMLWAAHELRGGAPAVLRTVSVVTP